MRQEAGLQLLKDWCLEGQLEQKGFWKLYLRDAVAHNVCVAFVGVGAGHAHSCEFFQILPRFPVLRQGLHVPFCKCSYVLRLLWRHQPPDHLRQQVGDQGASHRIRRHGLCGSLLQPLSLATSASALHAMGEQPLPNPLGMYTYNRGNMKSGGS